MTRAHPSRRVAGRRVQLVLPVAGMLLLAGGCSGGGEDTSIAPSNSAGSAKNSVSIAELEPDHLTPGWTSGAGIDMSNALFAPLVSINAKNEIQYVQAESITSPDNRVWTIKIKPGWTFHNGEPVTAQSYADGFNTTAYAPNGFNNNFELAAIEGYDKLSPASGKPSAKTLSGLKVINGTTLQLTLTAPNSQLLVEMSGGYAWTPLPKVALKDLKAFDEAPIGDGPFMMDGVWQHDVEIKMKRWDKYQGVPAKVDALQFKVYSSSETAYTDTLAGNVDIMGGTGIPIPSAKLSQLKMNFPNGVINTPVPSVYWLGFPSWDPKFADIRVRHAISMAIDRKTINDKIFGGFYGEATGLIAPGTIGGATTSCGEFCAYNPSRANALLAEAGGWVGEMPIYYRSDTGQQEYWQAIANNIRQNLGIQVKLTAFPNFTQFFAGLDAKKWTGPFRAQWASGQPTPASLFNGVFVPSATYNSTSGSYTSRDVTKLISDAAAADTDQLATELYHEADAKIMSDFPVAPILFTNALFVHSTRVSDVNVNSNGVVILTDLSVSP